MTRLWVACGALVVAAGCAGPSLLGGEAPINPEPPPPELEVLVVAGDDGTPMPDAELTIGGNRVATDDEGYAAVTWPGQPVTVAATAAGYERAATEVPTLPIAPVELRLAPTVLRGVVLAADGKPLPLARVALGSLEAVSADDGSFALKKAEPGEVQVTRPAWQPASVRWEGEGPVTVTLQPREVRALRVSAQAAGDPAHWNQLLRLTDGTTVNALVVDIKDESGEVMYTSDVPLAGEIGALVPRYDVVEVLADMGERDLFPIARIIAFQDPILAVARPEWAATDSASGEPWQDGAGNAWLDPTDPEAWQYSIDLAAEACGLGFGEVQFDYARFPSGGPTQRLVLDGGSEPRTRVDSVAGYLAAARERLNPLGCAVSVSVLGIIPSVSNEQGVGQRFETVAAAVDVISPQIYPRLFGSGWLQLDNPNDYPAEVVGYALDGGLPRLSGSTQLRPWLQTVTYGATEITIEINEAEERGLGWMLWNASAEFARSALPPEA